MGNSARQVNARVTTDFDRLDADDPSAFAPRIAGDPLLDHDVVRRGVSWWGLWAAIAFACGVLFRLIDLGAYALGPGEGGYAFQGWSVFRGEGAYGASGLPNVSRSSSSRKRSHSSLPAPPTSSPAWRRSRPASASWRSSLRSAP